MNTPLIHLELPEFPKVRAGKVREVFDLGDSLLLVATDRISAFDVIMTEGVPRKGSVLTHISRFWFDRTKREVPNHLISHKLPPGIPPELASRAMHVRKASPLPLECIVRGYLSGSAWKEYKATGSLWGQPLPPRLEESDRLPEPLFTPTSKAHQGHDEPLTTEQAIALVGQGLFDEVRRLSLALFDHASSHCAPQGILLADTKFEFGLCEGELILIDEALTPDSSRFWPADQYAPGRPQPSFDKQFLRDYLESLDWDKTPPAPSLPCEVIEKTAAKYLDACRRITGTEPALG